ncbi:hypothetical protein Y032_0289g1504 [Ancylostoma ceylanicum]|nr:hypothetical protein Y032_0289g1504 [Ancylostoma ceylanicum]
MLYPPNKAEAINNTCATRRNCDALIQILAARTRQCRMELSKWLNFQISAEHQFQIHEVLFHMADDEFEEEGKPEQKARKPLKRDKYAALVLAVDCGSSMQETSGGRSHFCMAKEAADWILSRKIFTQAKDRISIILFGCEEARNPLDISGVFLQDEVLSRISFDHLRFLNHEVNINLKSAGNAVDALLVATDFLHQQTDGDAAVESKNILILTNGLTHCANRDSEISAVVNGANAMEANIVAIGINENQAEESQSSSQILEIIKRTDGLAYSFE